MVHISELLVFTSGLNREAGRFVHLGHAACDDLPVELETAVSGLPMNYGRAPDRDEDFYPTFETGLAYRSYIDTLGDNDFFGTATANPGDLDGNGVMDMAVGAPGDDDGGTGRGAVYVLFMNTDGTVKSHQKISDTEGNFSGTLDDGDSFGNSLTSLGDLNGDGITDLAVGAHGDDDRAGAGATYVLFLNADGTVKSSQIISATEGNFSGVLQISDFFGYSLSTLGDLDNDGIFGLLFAPAI